jgi:hypothetical protein
MRTLITATCHGCGKEFSRRSRGRNRTDTYCSRACGLERSHRPSGTGDPRLTPTERLVRYYSTDCALCSCKGERHAPSGLMCIKVGRDRRAGTDRCLTCGEAWTVREYRWQPATKVQRVMNLTVPCAKYIARGVPCVPDGDACAQCGNQVAA